MPKLSGAFNCFKNLDRIPPDALNKWLRLKKEPQFLLNFLGNRIIYPQTVAATPEDMEIDLAILREALKNEPESFYLKKDNLIQIPEEFVYRFVPEFKLLASIIDGLEPEGLVKIVLKEKKRILASYYGLNKETITKIINDSTSVIEKDLIEVLIGNKPFKLLPNTLTLIPFNGGEQTLKFKSLPEIKFNPGDMGIYIDLRIKKNVS